MDPRHLLTLLPCDGLGDFPTHFTEQDASEALHNWTAAWHPALLAATARLPGVWSSFSPPDIESARGCVLLIPALAASSELDEWRERLAADPEVESLCLDSIASRDQIIAALEAAGIAFSEASKTWASDFYALGYAYLQTELLTQNLVYASVINPDELEESIIAAAKAAVAGKDDEVETALRKVYDLLEQVRDHSYPAETNLLDLVLLSDTTLGQRLDRELAEPTPKSFLLSPELCQALAEKRSDALATLGEQGFAVTCNPNAGLACLPPASLAARVEEAFHSAEALLSQPAAAFVLTEPGVPPRLAETLASRDAPGLVIAPLGGAAPNAGQSRIVCEGLGGGTMETLATLPRDAASAQSLLLHASRLSESLYRESVATQLFAAWAGCRHELFEDLRRVARRSNLLGSFKTLGQYFVDTQGVGTYAAMEDAELGPGLESLADGDSVKGWEHAYRATLDGVAQAAQRLSDAASTSDQEPNSLPGATALLAAAVGESSGPSEAVLVSNAWSYGRPVLLGDPADGWPCDLLATRYVPDVPGLGYRVVSREGASAAPRADAPARAEDGRLQSELLQVILDTTSGGIRSLRLQWVRRNRLSQKLVVLRGRRLIEVPTVVEVDAVKTLATTADRGAVRLEGRLCDLRRGLLAKFSQTLLLLANWNRLFVDLELDAAAADTKLDELHFASRMALPEGEHVWFRGVQWARLATHALTFNATDYVQAVSDAGSVTLGGTTLGRHRRLGARQLDSFLPHPPRGVSRHRLAIALDESRPLRVTLDLAAQAPALRNGRLRRPCRHCRLGGSYRRDQRPGNFAEPPRKQ